MSQTPDEYIQEVTVGPRERHDAPVVLVEYDPAWPALYAREEQKIRTALGDRALLVEHTGSTAVPGLAAKPIIDIVLVIEDTTDEDAYVPDLEDSGYTLRVREPDWHQHRMFKGSEPEVNLHVFPAKCSEVTSMLAFRDHLRDNDADRELYERTKRDLSVQTWAYVQHYADAKNDVVKDIMSRATAAA